MNSANPSCPECADAVSVPASPMAGEILACAGCGIELEVISPSPLELAPAPEIEEDWGE